MKFFAPDIWYKKELTFPQQPDVIWVLDEKLSEKSAQGTKEESTDPDGESIAWAVFACGRKDSEGDRHAVKIYMQIPWIDTEFTTLKQLTARDSKHTPHLVAEMHGTQDDDDDIVPGGFISYILMTWCPGVPLMEGDFLRKSRDEQIRIFDAFEDAEKETKRCGVISGDPNPGDLIWDADNDKCYMVDFKYSGRPSKYETVDDLWREWVGVPNDYTLG